MPWGGRAHLSLVVLVARDGREGARDGSIRVEHRRQLLSPLVDPLQLDDALGLVGKLQRIALEALTVVVADGVVLALELVGGERVGRLQ